MNEGTLSIGDRFMLNNTEHCILGIDNKFVYVSSQKQPEPFAFKVEDLQTLLKTEVEKNASRVRLNTLYRAFLDIIVHDLDIHPMAFHPDNDFTEYVYPEGARKDQIPTDVAIQYNNIMLYIDNRYNSEFNDPDAIYMVAMEHLGHPTDQTAKEIIDKEA